VIRRRIVVDATGVGAGITSWLAQEYSEEIAEQLAFGPASKSKLGYLLLGMVNTGRCKVFGGDGSEDYTDFWKHASLTKYEMKPHSWSEPLRPDH
jgi:hypothetical protein